MYQIVYGLETESVESPTQIVLLDLPEEFSDMESEDLEQALHYEHEIRSRKVGEAPTPFTFQELHGFQDMVESFVLAMRYEGVTPEQIDAIVTTVSDAFTNNS